MLSQTLVHIFLSRTVSGSCLEMPWRPSYAPSKFGDSHGRSFARSLGRSAARSLDRLVAWSLGRSVVRSLDRSVARSLDRSIARLLSKHAWGTTECCLGEPVPPTDPIRFLNLNCKNPSSAAWLGNKQGGQCKHCQQNAEVSVDS